MTAKELFYDQRARAKLLMGVDALANVVKVTLGPKGRHVLLEASYGSPTITKDGATVARVVELEDRFANLGARMVREAAEKTNALAGDGTTTATVLAQAIYREGSRLVAAGHAPKSIKRGIDIAVERVVLALKAMAKPTKSRSEIAQVGALSANGDQDIGDQLASAMEKVGLEGIITVEEGKSTETTLELALGMQLERGFLSPYFVTDTDRMQAVCDEAYVLISEQKLSSLRELLPVLELVKKTKKPLVIIADEIGGDALSTLVVNQLRGSLRCVGVKAPSFGDRRKDTLRDIAALTGANPVSEELGWRMEDVGLADLGRARRVILDKDTTTIIDGGGSKDKLRERVDALRAELARTTSTHDEEKLRERLAKLTGGVAVLKVGAHTELEMKEKKGRVEDALHATRAAVQEGTVVGGGVALLRAQAALDTLDLVEGERAGVDVVRRALEEPMRRIAENAGVEGSVVVDRARAGSGDFGYNAATGEYGQLLAMGVVDPVRVVRSALQNAASVAGLMLTIECLIAQHR